MTDVVLITTGEYGEVRTVAVAESEAAAQAWADRYNLDNLDAIRGGAYQAVVGERVPFAAAGAR